MSDWKPIETAPKDGTEILTVFCNDYGDQKIPTVYGPWTALFTNGLWLASWDGELVIESQTDFGTDYKSTAVDPTHWMPLPKPPT